MRILVLTQWDSDATYFFRLKPLFYIDHPRIKVERKPYNGQISYSFFDGYDVLVLERPSGVQDLQVIKLAKQCGLKIISDYDDDIIHLTEMNPMYHTYEAAKQTVCECIAESDEVWVSTQGVKRSFALLNKNIHVLPNCHDDFLHKVENKKPFNRTEKKVIWRGGGCFDEETEVLTKGGFKFFRDLSDDDLIATLRQDGLLVYTKIENYIEYHYKGKMHYYKNGYVDCLVTPNHNIFSSDARHGEYSLRKSESIFGTDIYFKLNCVWNGKPNVDCFEIPQTKDTGATLKWDIDDFLKFFGFWLADGWSWTRGISDCGQVGFALFKGDIINDEIIRILDKYNFKHTKRFKDGDFNSLVVCDNNLFNYLRQFGKAHEKFIPEWLLELPSDKIKLFLDWYLKGDGHEEWIKGRIQPRIRAFTSSKKLANNLVDVAIKIGWAASVKNRGIRKGGYSQKLGYTIQSRYESYDISFLQNSVRNFLQVPIKNTDQTEVDFDGMVYCVTVKNHVMYVKRNGKCYWSGNSHQPDVYEKGEFIVDMVNKNPDWMFYFLGDRFIWLEQRCGKNYQPVSPMPLMQYFEFLSNLNCQFQFHPLSNTIFNKSKSNIAFIESVYAGSVFFGEHGLPEFNKDGTGDVSDLNGALNFDSDILSDMNDASWDYIQQNLLLSNINKIREGRLLNL